MKTFLSAENDGTIIISNTIDMPRQGTYISVQGGKYTVAKGVVRPCLIDSNSLIMEDEAYCEESAFGKTTQPQGTFYSLNETGDQKCRLAMQTLYFGFRDPAALIREDTKRFSERSALEFTSKENKRKIAAGVNPSLLLEQIAVWDLFRRVDVPGTRSTVFASELVPINADPVTIKMSAEDRLQHTLFDDKTHKVSYFKLLQGTAKKLAQRLGCKISDLTGKVMVVHRDPALPDASTCYLAMCAGTMSWSKEGIKNEGIVFNPADPLWKAAGGDFDGDTAVLLQPSPLLYPLDTLPRLSYRVPGAKHEPENALEAALESVDNRITQLLGPVVLAATRLVERGYDDDSNRSLAAGLAQATVEAKKHIVNTDDVSERYRYLLQQVQDASNGGEKPFITDFVNVLRRAEGLDAKIQAWNNLVKYVDAGLWSNGTDIEEALCERILVMDSLFKDIDFFRQQRRATLPLSIVNAAKKLCSDSAKGEMQALTQAYAAEVQNLPQGTEEEDLDEEDVVVLRRHVQDKIKTLNTRFQLACITGQIGGIKTNALDAQYAMVAYGPARLAARLVPVEVFEALGTQTKRMLTNLVGHNWINKEYNVSDLKPIPSCKSDYQRFADGSSTLKLVVVHKAKASTRVMLEV